MFKVNNKDTRTMLLALMGDGRFYKNDYKGGMGNFC